MWNEKNKLTSAIQRSIYKPEFFLGIQMKKLLVLVLALSLLVACGGKKDAVKEEVKADTATTEVKTEVKAEVKAEETKVEEKKVEEVKTDATTEVKVDEKK